MYLRNLSDDQYRVDEEVKANEIVELIDFNPGQVHSHDEKTFYEPLPFHNSNTDHPDEPNAPTQCINQ